MVTIKFYNIQDRPTAINKTLGEPVATVSGYLLNADVVNPVIKLQAVAGRFNYAYIPELNRYYFVAGATVDDNNFITAKFTTDVLYTYQEKIIAALATCKSSDVANYLNTVAPVYDQRAKLMQVDFADVFHGDGKIIMVTIKGD